MYAIPKGANQTQSSATAAWLQALLMVWCPEYTSYLAVEPPDVLIVFALLFSLWLFRVAAMKDHQVTYVVQLSCHRTRSWPQAQ